MGRPFKQPALSLARLHLRLGAALILKIGDDARLDESHFCDWASATFCGARHFYVVNVTASPARLAELGDVGEWEFDLPGHIIAEAAMTRLARNAEGLSVITFELLSVAD